MTMLEIPDVSYELSDDGNILSLQQGSVDPSYFQLHKLHIKHFAELMSVSSRKETDDVSLTDYLEMLRDDAENLCEFLSSIPSFPPKDEKDEDELLAEKLLRRVELGLAMWGSDR